MTAEAQPSHRMVKERRIITFACLVVFLDMTGVGLILPITPDLIIALSDVPVSRAAELGGLLLFTYAAMLFLAAPILGALSDQFGRRPVILLALTGFAIDYFVMAAAPSLIWLFIGRALSGIFGGTFPAANATVADISTQTTRARNFGLIGGATGAGLVLGPALGGILGEFGVRLPFIAAGLITGGAAIAGYFAFPEPLPREKRRPFSWHRANPVGAVLQLQRNRAVIGLLAAIFFFNTAQQALSSVWTYHTIEMFGWTPLEIGLSVGLYGVLYGGVQGVLTGPVTQRFGEMPTAIFGLVLGVGVYLWFAFAQAEWMLYTGLAVGALTAFVVPVIQTIMTREVAEDAQGELQGAVAATISLTAIIGPLIMTQTFGVFTGGGTVYWPGAPYALAAAIGILCLVAFYWGARQAKPRLLLKPDLFIMPAAGRMESQPKQATSEPDRSD